MAPAATWTGLRCKKTGEGRRGGVTRPAQPGPGLPGGKSGAWDSTTPSPSPSCATSQRDLSSSPKHPPTHLLLPLPRRPAWPHAAPSLLSGGRLCLLATQSHSLSRSRHPLTDTPEGCLTETWPTAALSHPPGPGPCTPHHTVSARLALQPFSASTQPSCWAIGSLFLPRFQIVTTYNSPACLSSLECQRCTLRG